MRPLTTADLSDLMTEHQPPCVSVYLPTPRTYPDRQQGPIHYRNLVDQVEASLRRAYPGAPGRALLDQFRHLGDDDAYWTHRLDGLAVLGSPDEFHALDLPRPVPERAVVADSFHVKPLLRIAQSADRYHVLCLQREAAALYEGNRDGLRRIEPDGVPLAAADAFGAEIGVAVNEQVAGGKTPAPSRPAMGDGAKLDAERYFRVLDRAVWDRVTRPSDLPLVVAALPEHQAAFRAVSKNTRLLDVGIEKGPASLDEKELRAAAWKCVEPSYLARLHRFVEDFQTARARGLGSDDLDAAARAAHDGRVGILLVEAERVIPGRLDPTTGEALQAAVEGPVDDLLDDLAEKVLRMKGTAVVVPAERMPTTSGLAAIYRF